MKTSAEIKEELTDKISRALGLNGALPDGEPYEVTLVSYKELMVRVKSTENTPPRYFTVTIAERY